MKKIFALFLTICLMASMFSVTAFAAANNTKVEPQSRAENIRNTTPPPAPGVVMTVGAFVQGGWDLAFEDHYTNFEEGWTAAMSLAGNVEAMRTKGYSSVVVDLYADWTSAENGNFTDDGWLTSNDPGFNSDTICIPENARVVLDLNGYTIKRRLSSAIRNGEVMFVSKGASIMINNGTITGGKSYNGAGGIHVDGAELFLTDVNIEGNIVEDDNGAAIALYNGSYLSMSGGSMSYNHLTDSSWFVSSDGTVFISDSSATIKNVSFYNNLCYGRYNPDGSIIYMKGNSTASLSDCHFEENGSAYEGLTYNGKPRIAADSLFHLNDTGCVLSVSNCRFKNNGSDIKTDSSDVRSTIFDVDGHLNVSNCEFTETKSTSIFASQQDAYATIRVTDSRFDNNDAQITRFTQHVNAIVNFHFINCYFRHSSTDIPVPNNTFEGHPTMHTTFIDCDFNDSVFSNQEYMTFVTTKAETETETTVSDTTGFMLGEGSLATIVSFSSLIVSVIFMVVTIVAYKKNFSKKKANEETADAE